MQLVIDAHDQPAIVRQYMRYTVQIQSGKTASRQIMRALQMCVATLGNLITRLYTEAYLNRATSQPTGPVYLWARREATEEDVDEDQEGLHPSRPGSSTAKDFPDAGPQPLQGWNYLLLWFPAICDLTGTTVRITSCLSLFLCTIRAVIPSRIICHPRVASSRSAFPAPMTHD